MLYVIFLSHLNKKLLRFFLSFFLLLEVYRRKNKHLFGFSYKLKEKMVTQRREDAKQILENMGCSTEMHRVFTETLREKTLVMNTKNMN